MTSPRLVLGGTSLGGYLAARAAAFEHRIAACILHDGVYDVHQAFEAVLPVYERGGIEAVLALGAGARWLVRNGLWTFGVADLESLVAAASAYTQEGVAGLIRCPTLVLDAENDLLFCGQPARVQDALTCAKRLIVGTEAEGSTDLDDPAPPVVEV